MKIITFIVIIWIAIIVYMIYEISSAEEGWEDEEGYHRGRKERQSDEQQITDRNEEEKQKIRQAR